MPFGFVLVSGTPVKCNMLNVVCDTWHEEVNNYN